MDQNTNPQNNQANPQRNSGDKKPKFNMSWIYGAIAIVLFVSFFISPMGSSPIEIDWKRFKVEMLKNHDVLKIEVVNNDRAEIFIKPEKLNESRYADAAKGASKFGINPQYFFTIGSVDKFEEQLAEATQQLSPTEEVPVRFVKRENHMNSIMNWFVFPLILIVVWLFIFRRMTGGGMGGGNQIFNVGKSRAKMFDKDSTEIKIDFKDVAGLEEAKVEIKEIVDFLKNPKKYTDLGGKIPKGALLVGPPGTGKTLLAKAVAGEAHVPFFSMSGSDFVEMFVGVGASRVRDLFKQAKEKAPCIIFIDEIDAIGRARGKNPNFGSNDERENTLNQLLTEMDGFGTNSGVIILAATNRADILDRALMRAGRFDRQIHVELPDLNERAAIFNVHLRPLKKLDAEVNAEMLAKQTPGFSGAEIANVVNEAALIAARHDKKLVEKQDFLDAIDRIVGGLEKKNKIISPAEKKTIAYHEAGHATVSWMLEHANPLIKVTIVPRGQALGAAWYLPEERQLTTRAQMMDELASLLGGRCAEELFFNMTSTGALNDLERATKMAYAMVSYYGMSEKIGLMSYFDSSGQSEYSFSKPYSEETARLIDSETKLVIEEAFRKARKVLSTYEAQHHELAQLLLDREVLFAEDLERILGPRPGQPAEHAELTKVKQPETDALAMEKDDEDTSENDANQTKQEPEN
ncbi:MAG: ATP-dependent zinc metalloprotease FtsH [Salinivirgaceae bacterium]|nr:ATP-dependent zinc metalloprotease FtsH [Salinivirgaceae bacterium]